MDDRSTTISAETCQPQISGDLTRLQSYLRALERVVVTRDKKLKIIWGYAVGNGSFVEGS